MATFLFVETSFKIGAYRKIQKCISLEERLEMVRPECFKAPYVTSRNVPYGPAGTWPTDNFLGEGVLAKGQTVWLKCTRDKGSAESLVPAFVEHLGPIVVDARFLVDLGQHVTSSLQKWRGSSPIDQEARYRHRGTASK
jgi:hypothetical protein